jgi:hypothetical protein
MASTIVTEYDWESDTWTAPHALVSRQEWRAIVAEIADKARAKLPECNGRVDMAVKLVLAGDVELQADGSAKVASQSNGTTAYHVINGECSCKDYAKAPHQFCKHRLGAAIARRAHELTKARSALHTPEPAPEPRCLTCHTTVSVLAEPLCTGCHRCKAHCQQTTPECLYPTVPVPQPEPAQPAPDAPEPVPASALPEAPVSITLKATLHGHEVMVTLRGTDFESVKAQVEQASDWLKVQAPAQPPTQPPAHGTGQPTHDDSPYCHRHKTAMKRFSKDGRTWYSHKTADGRWCKGQ